MANQVLFDRPSYSNGDSLILAIFIALIVHIVVGMSVKFSSPKAEKLRRSSIDVTISQSPVKKVPKKAKFLGTANQEGAGKKVEKYKPAIHQAPEPAEQNEPLPEKQKAVKRMQSDQDAAHEFKQQAIQKAVVRKASEKQMATADKPAPLISHKTEEKPHLDLDTLHKQMADVGEAINQHEQGSDNNKIKTVAQVSTHKYVASQYIYDWGKKIERIGTLNFPDLANHKSVKLSMDVGINADGSIHSIRIRRSSGIAAVDQQAKKIVKMAAPYPPLPSSLLKELNVLVITRNWEFSDNALTAN